jgi:hypothetical protein
MSGYASPDIFKPGATPVAPEAPAAPIDTPAPEAVAEPIIQPEQPAQPVEVKEEVKPVEIKPVEPIVAPAQPVQPVNPLDTLKLEDVAAYYKNKREDVFKALGLDEFSIEALKYYEATGGLAEYAAVKSVDYSKMSDEKVLRQQLREELANLDLEDEDLELLYESRIKSRFKLDEDAYSEREVKAGKLELKYEADKARRAFVERQKKFAPPDRKPEVPADPGPSAEEQATQALQAAMADTVVQQFVNGKKLVLGSGEHSFNYEFPNPQDLLDILFIPEQYAHVAARKDTTGQPLKDRNGSYIPDYNRLLKAVAVLVNDADYDNRLINYGKSLGTKEVVDKMENPATTQTPAASNQPATVWQAMKQQGVKWPDLPNY